MAGDAARGALRFAHRMGARTGSCAFPKEIRAVVLEFLFSADVSATRNTVTKPVHRLRKDGNLVFKRALAIT